MLANTTNGPPSNDGGTARVSVVIPSYNGAKFLRQAIDSVLDQDVPNVQIIVVDDGSTDDTKSVVDRFGDRVSYIYQENRGVSSARNRGLSLAAGEYVVFLDADDYMLPGKIRDQLDAFETLPSLDLVHSGWDIVSAEGALTHRRMPWTHVPVLNLETFLLWKPVQPAAIMFRKAILDRVGGFDPDLSQAEDVDLLLRIFLKRGRAAWLKKVTACYRQHEHGAMGMGDKQAAGLERVLDKFFSTEGLPPRIKTIESRVRFSTCMWLVWHLYRTGHPETMARYLEQAQAASRLKPVSLLTVLHWQYKLSQVAFNGRGTPEDIEAIWPVFRRVAGCSDGAWAEMEAALGFWLKVWRHYLDHDELAAVVGLRAYAQESSEEVMAKATPSIFFSANCDASSAAMFHDHMRLLGIEPHPRSGAVTAAYLSLGSHLFSQGALIRGVRAMARWISLGMSRAGLRLWLVYVVRPGLRHLLASLAPPAKSSPDL